MNWDIEHELYQCLHVHSMTLALCTQAHVNELTMGIKSGLTTVSLHIDSEH